ncbi:MAG: SDR family NAD(P)-dependent oxidoreductase [Betaproteobacteria bacterium]|nr:SDR family NAD(P)-dependent oxidoreductase [Betaproteobacteria bacterium]
MADVNELEGKVAIVTGGARNIGRTIACALGAGGAAVMVNARTSRTDAQTTVELIRAAGGRAALHIADITDADAVARMAEACIAEFGRLDILVNNAAIRAETQFGARGLGPHLHSMLAVSTEGVPIGVLDAQFTAPVAKSSEDKRASHEIPIE